MRLLLISIPERGLDRILILQILLLELGAPVTEIGVENLDPLIHIAQLPVERVLKIRLILEVLYIYHISLIVYSLR